MACLPCGSGGSQPITKKPMSDINGTMKEFIIANGWTYQGDCTCRPSFGIYVNKDFPKYQIWLCNSREIMQIRFQNNGRDTWVKSQAGIGNFKQEYIRYFA
jgi:hypothetical protein